MVLSHYFFAPTCLKWALPFSWQPQGPSFLCNLAHQLLICVMWQSVFCPYYSNLVCNYLLCMHCTRPRPQLLPLFGFELLTLFGGGSHKVSQRGRKEGPLARVMTFFSLFSLCHTTRRRYCLRTYETMQASKQQAHPI